MTMRKEADVSTLPSVQWGVKIIVKQWMTVSVCIPDVTQQGGQMESHHGRTLENQMELFSHPLQ